MNDIIKIDKSLEEFRLLIKDISETIKKKQKKKGGFREILWGNLGASLLGNLLTGKGTIRGRWRHNYNRWKFLMQLHPLTNFEIQKYYEDEPKFNGVYSINNSSKTKDGAYIINLDEYEWTGTHWIALYVNAKNVTYFYSFGVEHIPEETKTFIRNKNITTNSYRI